MRTGSSSFNSFTGIGSHSSGSVPTYALDATISGLNATGLELQVNGAEVSVAQGATTETLASALPSGTSYSVSVTAQPTGEMCTVAGGSGTIQAANAANVVVTCSDQAFSLGGSINGLNGPGLVLANGTDTLAVTSGAASFTMPTAVAYSSSYSVTIRTQPAGLACAVASGTGTMLAGAVTSLVITCSDQPFTLGGIITGLSNNAGLVLSNGSDALAVAAGSTSFTMPTAVAFGSPYLVAVQSAPAGLTCTASNASATMPAGNVTRVVIACADQSYAVGGSISGLITSGMVLVNGSDTLAVDAGSTSFTMPTAVAFTSNYAVTVQTQPTGLTCSVSNGAGPMGSAAVTDIEITCSANTYTVGGAISGLTASGLVLLDNGGDATSINANATQFTLNTGVAYGSTYAITVQAQPAGQVCSVANAAGPVGAADVMNVSIACMSNFSLLHSFAGGSGDGSDPYHSLIQGSDGNFYGSTYDGGASNAGAIFKIAPTGTDSVLYSFASTPYTVLIQASDGNFYGTTAGGGSSGRGTVFQLTPSGAETVLYSFPAGGSDPYCGVIEGTDGNFYGTTGANGVNDDGTVFKITPTGMVTVLHVFPKTGGSDGQTPYAGLIQGSDGNFYGTTYFGGSNGFGTVFKVTPSGAETILHAFAGGADGEHPYAGLVQGSDGNFYGTTYQGGNGGFGTVFKITPGGIETVMYTFAGGTGDGANPEAGLIQGSDGNFYGNTYQGGSSGLGTVFELTPTGSETILHSFAGSSDGAGPSANLVQGSDGNLYGSTGTGGASNYGTFFKVALH